MPDDIALALSNRATSRCYSKWMLPAQIGGCACVLLWPLGAVAGTMGIIGLVGLGGGSVVAGLLMAGQETAKIAKGDRDALAANLTDDDIAEFKAMAQVSPPKHRGALMPAHSTTTPAPIPGNVASEPVEVAPVATPAPVGHLHWRDGEHLVLIGLSGASKTTTLIDCVPTTSPVIYITLKSEDKAPDGWKAYRLRKFADRAFLQQLDDLCTMLTGLVQAKRAHRLIIDEALTILDQARDAQKVLVDKEDKADFGAVPARFEGLLKMYIRTGRSDGHWLGLVTQSPNGTDLFGSAKTMQGLKLVLCAGEASSNKFDFLVPWAKQLYGQFFTAEDESRMVAIQSGYWHFWLESGRIQYRPTPKSDRTLHDIPMLAGFHSLTATPAPDVPAEVDWGALAEQLLEQPAEVKGLRKAAAAVTGLAIGNGGPKWQEWKSELLATLPTLDPNLVDRLRERYPEALS
jgi:hypothetical protein